MLNKQKTLLHVKVGQNPSKYQLIEIKEMVEALLVNMNLTDVQVLATNELVQIETIYLE